MSALYLALPTGFSADLLARMIDAADGAVQCVRFPAEPDHDALTRTAEALLAVTGPRDVALLIEDRPDLVCSLGLDGVHLASFATAPREARQTLGQDFIVGAFAGASQHRAMVMAEMEADYVALGSAAEVDPGLFQWWAETIETPLVAEGVGLANAAGIVGHADFIVPEAALLRGKDPAAAIGELARVIAA